MNYITQGTTITIQTAVLNTEEWDTTEVIKQEREIMKKELIHRIENMDPQDMVAEEERANCTYLTIRCIMDI